MKFDVPTRSEVNETNQGIFDHLEKAVGFVPNIYATFALSLIHISEPTRPY